MISAVEIWHMVRRLNIIQCEDNMQYYAQRALMFSLIHRACCRALGCYSNTLNPPKLFGKWHWTKRCWWPNPDLLFGVDLACLLRLTRTKGTQSKTKFLVSQISFSLPGCLTLSGVSPRFALSSLFLVCFRCRVKVAFGRTSILCSVHANVQACTTLPHPLTVSYSPRKATNFANYMSLKSYYGWLSWYYALDNSNLFVVCTLKTGWMRKKNGC
jgi:hypothetical protein